MDLIQRRRKLMMMGGSEQWVLVRDITLGGDVITPTAYNSATQEYQVDSFPSWATAAVGTVFNVILVIDDFSDMSKVPIPYGNDGKGCGIKKTDDTHFIITNTNIPSDVTRWRLARLNDVTKVEIISADEYESLRGIPLRLEIENTSSYITRYSGGYKINGRNGYSQGGTLYTTDCVDLGYDTSRKLLGYLDLEFTLSTTDATYVTTKVNKQTCVTCHANGTITNKETTNLVGNVSGNLWGKIATTGVYIGGQGISRPDCRIKLYKKI